MPSENFHDVVDKYLAIDSFNNKFFQLPGGKKASASILMIPGSEDDAKKLPTKAEEREQVVHEYIINRGPMAFGLQPKSRLANEVIPFFEMGNTFGNSMIIQLFLRAMTKLAQRVKVAVAAKDAAAAKQLIADCMEHMSSMMSYDSGYWMVDNEAPDDIVIVTSILAIKTSALSLLEKFTDVQLQIAPATRYAFAKGIHWLIEGFNDSECEKKIPKKHLDEVKLIMDAEMKKLKASLAAGSRTQINVSEKTAKKGSAVTPKEAATKKLAAKKPAAPKKAPAKAPAKKAPAKAPAKKAPAKSAAKKAPAKKAPAKAPAKKAPAKKAPAKVPAKKAPAKSPAKKAPAKAPAKKAPAKKAAAARKAPAKKPKKAKKPKAVWGWFRKDEL